MVTVKEMQELEDLSEKNGVTKLMLMENAGKALYRELTKRYGHKKYLIVCGSGNNGGDGFVLARLLCDNAYDAKVLFLGEESRLKKESGFNFLQLKEKHPLIFIQGWIKADIVVDSMLGTGVTGQIREPYASAIDRINKSGATVISVDIPTGVDPDTGNISDKAVEPDLVITFHDVKPGIEKYDPIVVDIGIKL